MQTNSQIAKTYKAITVFLFLVMVLFSTFSTGDLLITSAQEAWIPTQRGPKLPMLPRKSWAARGSW